ncbi:hypothetical protein E0H75_31680 [Kribbella capetownensis]|uniref:Glycosyl hydrolase family 98 putative carbohydrate-binding module domain-containing protein n=1 Tax=Kribbella capetownensis TaxID=1572659 RepID=A0A4R0JHD1_9ACTN|nr:hypothetical protein [Kribbella capetownensis]TCC45074.1 hypothetical protein E0H75_31680 [Kribbella capetownensis]
MKLRILATVLVLGLAATGCGDDAPNTGAVAAQTTAPTPTESPTATETTPTETIPTDTPSVDSPSEEPSEPEDSEKPAVLPPEAANRPLTLSSIFKYPDGWRDGRYDVADRKQATGIGGTLNGCGDSYGQVLELRLANNFSKIKLEFGESNSSESSEQILQVRLDGNSQYIDQKTVKLNQIAAFDLPVQKVNALKISLSLKDSDGCGSGEVEAVLMNMVLS